MCIFLGQQLSMRDLDKPSFFTSFSGTFIYIRGFSLYLQITLFLLNVNISRNTHSDSIMLFGNKVNYIIKGIALIFFYPFYLFRFMILSNSNLLSNPLSLILPCCKFICLSIRLFKLKSRVHGQYLHLAISCFRILNPS